MFNPNAEATQILFAKREATLELLHDGGAPRLLPDSHSCTSSDHSVRYVARYVR